MLQLWLVVMCQHKFMQQALTLVRIQHTPWSHYSPYPGLIIAHTLLSIQYVPWSQETCCTQTRRGTGGASGVGLPPPESPAQGHLRCTGPQDKEPTLQHMGWRPCRAAAQLRPAPPGATTLTWRSCLLPLESPITVHPLAPLQYTPWRHESTCPGPITVHTLAPFQYMPWPHCSAHTGPIKMKLMTSRGLLKGPMPLSTRGPMPPFPLGGWPALT